DPTTGAAKDTALFMADALAEEVIPGTGTFTLEGQYYKFNDGYNFGPAPAPSHAFYVLVSYLTPEPVGSATLQPLVRVQQTIDPAWTIIDAGLAYVFKDYGMRIVANYQHIDRGTSSIPGATPTDAVFFDATRVQNAVQLGFQLQAL